ncbi:Bromodomain-containing protein [Lanmaoa asiatica]|nr:Bromodomain-containing protein [Lanmaoa asiatica]
MNATDTAPHSAPTVGIDDKPAPLDPTTDVPPENNGTHLIIKQPSLDSVPNGHVYNSLDSPAGTSPMSISPSDSAFVPIQPPAATPPPPPVQADAAEDIKMAETPEAIVEEMLVSSAPSPDLLTNGALNGKITSPEAPNMDADGDVKMEQATHVNGYAETVDAKLATHHDSFTTCRSPNHAVSPHPVDADAGDDARPPPAKRARKYSDADQASIANTASPPPATGSSIQMNEEVTSSPVPAPPTPVSTTTLSIQQHRFCLSTVRSLKKMKDAAAFLHPVDPVALNIPHYSSIIKNPMDLGTIERKLTSSNPQKPDMNPNNPRYNNADEFIADIRLVFTNCLTFNGPDHAISKAGKHLESVFDKQIKNIPPPQVVKPSVKIATPPPPPPPTKKVNPAPPAPARRASTSVPVIRRNDIEQASARPKREIHPPPPKDLPYADVPKKLRKTKVVKDDGSAEQLKFCAKLLVDLHRKQYLNIAQPFYEPVDPVKLEIPAYFKIIKKPMDLSTMRKKLENHEYPNASKFFDDFKLMIRNCFTFNPAGTPVNQAGIELQRLFDEKWKNLPPLREPSRIASIEAQIESMRGNLQALKNQPQKQIKKKKKEPKPAAASTSKTTTSRNTKVPNAANGAVKRKAKKQIPEDDTLSFDQKKDLSEAITKLDGQKLEKVIQIIHEGVPEIRDSTEEIEIEIDLLPVNVLTKLYNFVLRPLRQPPQKRSRATGKGTGTGGLKRKSMDENAEAEKIRQLEERMKLFDNPSGNTTVPTSAPILRHDDSDHSSDSSSDESSGSESE